MSSSLKVYEEQLTYLHFNINLLNYLGVWPLQSGPKFKKILNYIVAFSVLLQLIFFYLTELIDFYLNVGNIQIMTKTMCQITANTLLIFKIVYILYNHKKFKKLLEILTYNLAKYAQKQAQQKLIEQCDKRIKTYTIVYMIFGCIITAFWMIIPLLDYNSEETVLPFESWTPFDLSEPLLYALAYTIHGLHGMLFILYMPSCGMFIVGLIYHACAQFRILHYSLISLQTEGLSSTSQRLICEERNRNYKVKIDLQECIIHHQIILRYCMELEQILNPVMFIQLLTNGAAICVVSFQVTEVDVYSVRFLTMAVFLITVLFECGIYFWAGEELITQSLKTADAAYEIHEWYQCCASMKHSIRIIITQSQHPVKLTCGKLYVLSLNNFANVLKSSYSFCTVLRTLQD